MKLARLARPVRMLRLDVATEVAGTQRIRGGQRVRRNARLAWASPLCVLCLAMGRTSRATEWDHIVPLADGGSDSEANLQGLCAACHAIKTAGESASRWGGGAEVKTGSAGHPPSRHAENNSRSLTFRGHDADGSDHA